MVKFLLIIIGLSNLSLAIVTSIDQIATDSQTKLQWQDEVYLESEGIAENKEIEEGKALNWENAIKYCENLTLGGKDDWRLPNKYELVSIVDYNESSSSTIINGFINSSNDRFWTSTSVYNKSDILYIVLFGVGVIITESKSNVCLVRCVRGGL